MSYIEYHNEMSKIIKSIKLKYFKYYYLEFILVLIQMVNKKGLYGNKENNFEIWKDETKNNQQDNINQDNINQDNRNRPSE